MSFSLIADIEFKRFSDITAEYLKARGITLLLSDLDNTLTTRAVFLPDEEVCRWNENLKAAGIRLMVVSNNRSGSRVSGYCKALGVPFIGRAGKPGTKGIEQAMALVGAKKSETAMVGDRVTTDILAAKRYGITAFIVEQVGGHNNLWHGFCYMLQLPFRLPARHRRKKECENQKKS